MQDQHRAGDRDHLDAVGTKQRRWADPGKLHELHRRLLEARSQRVRPGTDELIFVIIRGDMQLSEAKLRKLVGAVQPASMLFACSGARAYAVNARMGTGARPFSFSQARICTVAE